MSDRDIKTWDERLKAQAERHWDNYVHRRIDLSTARLDEPFLIAGEFIYVEERSSVNAVAKIKIQKVNKESLDLVRGVEIYTVFTQVFITNDALQGEWLDLVFGINFIYKKKIALDQIDGPLNFLIGGPITTPAGIDLQILPGAGGITQIGDAGATSDGLVNNDDLFVSGKLEVDGPAHFDGQLVAHNSAIFYADTTFYNFYTFAGTPGALYGCYYRDARIEELLTIPIGQGAAGVVTAGNLVPANSTILGVCCRVTQAPGGGATTIDIGRTGGGNLDEFIDGIATALGTQGTFAANHDAATVGPVLNAAADTLTLTTDVNVAGADMKVRIVVFYRQETPPTS